MKRIICVLLALLLCIPVPVLAVGGENMYGRGDEQEEALQKVPAAQKDASGHCVAGGYLYLKSKETITQGIAVVEHTWNRITAKEGECLYVTYNPGNDGYYIQSWDVAHYNKAFGGCLTFAPIDKDLTFGDNCGANRMGAEIWVAAVTNLPIFQYDDYTAIEAYINSGDVSGAENKDELDYVEASPDDTVIRPDVNVINTGDFFLNDDGNLTLGNVSVGWKTEQEGDYYDLAVRAYFYLYKDKLNIDWAALLAGSAVTIGGILTKNISGITGGIATAIQCYGGVSSVLLASGLSGWSPTVSVKADSSGSSTYSFFTSYITDYINKYLATQPACKDYFISKFEVRVRHRVGNKYSKWRVCTIDYTQGAEGDASVAYDTRDDKDVTYSDGSSTEDSTVDVSGGNGVGDIVINIDNSNENANTNTNTNNNSNSNNDVLDQVINAGGGSGGNDGNGIDWSFGDLLGFLKGGFGLLGNSGFIALMSAVFPFLPAEIFTILTIGVAAAVVIMIINLLKRLFS